MAAGAQARWDDIEAATSALRRALVLRQLTRHSWHTIRGLLVDARRLVRRFLQPPGVTVVLCGADGSGKSTAAGEVMDGLKVTFPAQKVQQFHWKPPLFSARRQAARAPTTDPHSPPARNPAVLLLLLRVSLAGVRARLPRAVATDYLPRRPGAGGPWLLRFLCGPAALPAARPASGRSPWPLLSEEARPGRVARRAG